MNLDVSGGSEQGGQIGDGMEAPPVNVVEGQLVACAGALTAHEDAQHVSAVAEFADLDGGLRHLRAAVGLGAQRRAPDARRVGGDAHHRGPQLGRWGVMLNAAPSCSQSASTSCR
jgi:hypothetical protein